MDEEAVAGSFVWADYLVFVVVLLVSASIGLFHACSGGKQKTLTEFLLADRKQQCIPVGLSILVTFQSAILFLGVPAEIYTQGTSYLLFHIGMAGAVLFSAFVIVPLLHPLRLTSVYKYLELRFESKAVQIVGCLMGMLNMCLYMGVTVFAPATAIEAVSGFPAWGSIIVISALATIYTTLGGLRAVIWTDVFQFSIMCGGLLAILIQGSIMQGGLGRVWQQAEAGGRIDLGSWSPDPTIRHSVWSLVIGGTLTWLSNIGVNQASVQRFSSVPSLSAAKLSVLVSLPGFVIFGVLASFVGLIVYSYYMDVACDPLYCNRISNPNQLVPVYVVDVFHFMPGFTGLFAASLVCASLSTISSSINGLSAMLWEDVLRWKFPDVSEERQTLIVKCCVLLFGCVALGVAFLSLTLGGPATQIALSFFGASGGPLLGLFLLGALFPWANWIGALVGSLSSLTFCLWIAVGRYASGLASSSLPPAPSDQCYSYLHPNGNTTSTTTTVITETMMIVDDGDYTDSDDSHPLSGFYSISYLWYSGIGILWTIAVGLAVSFCTGATKPETVPSHLLIFGDRTYCHSGGKSSLKKHNGHHIAASQDSEDETEEVYDNVLAQVPSKPSIVSFETTI